MKELIEDEEEIKISEDLIIQRLEEMEEQDRLYALKL